MLEVGSKAPEFELLNQDGDKRQLKDYKGEWLVIYFYPKDDTPGCTKEACGIRDNYAELTKLARVAGVSKDSVKSHKKFADKYDLQFDLLSDEGLEMIKAYGAYGKKKMFGKEYDGVKRITYLVDPKGVVRKAYPKVSPAVHAEELIGDLKNLS